MKKAKRALTRLYTVQNLAEELIISLEVAASHHLLHVLRAQIGDMLTVFNGKGGEYSAQLLRIDQQQAILQCLSFKPSNKQSPLTLHLLQGISRNERMRYVIQKATELGVSTITPLFTEHTANNTLPKERLTKRIQYWNSIAIAACEQSGRCDLPKIKNPTSLVQYLSTHQGIGFISDMKTNDTSYEVPRLSTPKQITLLVGPEGGFSEREVQQTKEKNFYTLSLGPRILRTETATLAAITILQNIYGDIKCFRNTLSP